MRFNSPKIKFVSKGWGHEKWIVNKDLYCGKLLYFSKDRKCSLHYHKEKDEVFYIQSGKIELYYSDGLENTKEWVETKGTRGLYSFLDRIILEKGDNFYIPPGRVHQMIALEDTELFEFSTQHFEEDSFKLVKGD